jgi:kumamolisin
MSDRKIFQDSITPLPAEPGITPSGLIVNAMTPGRPDETLNVHFSLSVAPGVQAELEQKVAEGETVPLEELNKLYNAKPADKDALVTWLKTNGYEITRTSPDGIYARAKASQIASSLDVNMVPVTKDGITYTSAQNAPSLPAEVARAVRSINGLQPFKHANKHLRRLLPERQPSQRGSHLQHRKCAALSGIGNSQVVQCERLGSHRQGSNNRDSD